MPESPSEYMVGALSRVLGLHMGTALDAEAEDDTRRACEDILHDLSRPHRVGGVVAWLVDAVGVETLMRALADAIEPGNLVAAMVDEGVLVELDRSGWDPDSRGPSTNMAGQGRPRGSLPLYRAAEPWETS